MTAERVSAEQNDVGEQNQSPNPDPEMSVEPAGVPDVVGKDHEEDQGQIEEIAVDVLQDQRKRALAAILLARLTYRAGRRVSPEGLVVRAAVVVTGDAKASRRPQDQDGGREDQPGRIPCGFRSKPGVERVAEQLWRVERREVRSVAVVGALKRRPRGVNNETRKSQEYDEGLDPPRLGP